jgi:succinate dehydrogenase / fumarate reductase cytochrome b subunit
MFLVAAWALALASGQEAYEAYMGLLGSIPGKIVLFGFTVAVFLHLAGGVRHLAWDLGKGYAKGEATASAWVAIVFGFAAAIVVWIIAAIMGVL